MVRHESILSSMAGFLMMMPRLAATEMAPMIATGMASNRGQGVAMTRTARKRIGSWDISQAPPATANPNGEIDVINPTTAAIERVISTDGCKGPSGLAPGILGRWITGGGGCMVDPGAGTTIAIPDAGGDEVASVPALGVYAYMIAATRTLNLASGYTNQVYQKLDANGGHNLAANQTNGEIFVPDYDGKVVEVFAPTVPFGGGKGK